MLAGYRSPFDATVVRRLAEAGMVGLGKLNCDEFAMGSANENSAFGPVKNPWNPARAGRLLGRQRRRRGRAPGAGRHRHRHRRLHPPAGQLCGITGIKPTYGRASRYGMIAFASSLDQAGPMARSAEDCALLLSAMCGPDLDRDSTSLDVPAEDFTRGLSDSLDGLRIGVPQEFFGDGLAPTCAPPSTRPWPSWKSWAPPVPISLPRTELSIPVYYIIAPAEASSNLSASTA
jgi:aspartyl-tRNA(Asn)/glutamyl-tRNA(Gln) amidotransferase subunit A